MGSDLSAPHGDGERSAVPEGHEMGLHPFRPRLHSILCAKAMLHPHGHPATATCQAGGFSAASRRLISYAKACLHAHDCSKTKNAAQDIIDLTHPEGCQLNTAANT